MEALAHARAFQRQHSYAKQEDGDDVAPGRESISSRMMAPADPVESWLSGSLTGKDDAPQQAPPSAKAPAKAQEPANAKADGVDIAISTVEASPGGVHERATVGVGELVDLTARTVGDWTATTGTASARSKSTFRWKAPEKASTATITFTSGKQTKTTTLTVLAPETVSMKLDDVTDDPRWVGKAGFWAFNRVTLGPASVSFREVEVLEIPGGPSLVVGCFEHVPIAKQQHDPARKWVGVVGNNQLAKTDKCGFGGQYLQPPFSFGMLVWHIPWHYRLRELGGPGWQFATVTQVFTVSDKNGVVSVSKGGVTVTRAATSQFAISRE